MHVKAASFMIFSLIVAWFFSSEQQEEKIKWFVDRGTNWPRWLPAGSGVSVLRGLKAFFFLLRWTFPNTLIHASIGWPLTFTVPVTKQSLSHLWSPRELQFSMDINKDVTKMYYGKIFQERHVIGWISHVQVTWHIPWKNK